MNNSDESINPFTGMSNYQSMMLQNAWENFLVSEFGLNLIFSFGDIDHKLKKSNLYLKQHETTEFEIGYEQMCPSAIQFQFDVKI